jgi:hypothetical protein
MNEVKMRAYTFWDIAVYACSVVAIWTFMFHFWWPLSVASYVLWGVSGAFAIFSVYGGIIRRSEIQEEGIRKGYATAAAVLGCLILLGLTVSAVLLLVPLLLMPHY